MCTRPVRSRAKTLNLTLRLAKYRLVYCKGMFAVSGARLPMTERWWTMRRKRSKLASLGVVVLAGGGMICARRLHGEMGQPTGYEVHSLL